MTYDHLLGYLWPFYEKKGIYPCLKHYPYVDCKKKRSAVHDLLSLKPNLYI